MINISRYTSFGNRKNKKSYEKIKSHQRNELGRKKKKQWSDSKTVSLIQVHS